MVLVLLFLLQWRYIPAKIFVLHQTIGLVV
jgi:hypothetical protein